MIDTVTDQKVSIIGYDNEETASKDIKIWAGITLTDLLDGETVLLRVNGATLLGEKASSFLSVAQLRENGIVVDNQARRNGGTSNMKLKNYVVLVNLVHGRTTLKIRKPMETELSNCDMITLTLPIREGYATNTWFATVTSYERYNCVQVFCRIESGMISHYEFHCESDSPSALLDCFSKEGVPLFITRDN